MNSDDIFNADGEADDEVNGEADDEVDDDVDDREEGEISEEVNEVVVPNIVIEIPVVVLPQRRIRRREDPAFYPGQKSFRNEYGKRIIRDRTPQYTYLKLKSGEEFHFKEEDSNNLLIKDIESNRLIRNIISNIPSRVGERIVYLGKFNWDEEDESDEEEGEEEEENQVKVQKRYIGNLKDAVYTAYIKEWRLRFLFRRVLLLWRVYKMNKVCEKEIDPITLSEPEKEIYMYDWSNRRKFVFDAKSLATLIESKLMYNEYGFPVPQCPRNPKNNVEFSYKQLVSLYYQLKTQGELRWGFTTLREYNFNKNRWQLYHKSALTMNSIKSNLLLLDSYEARELFTDFIFAKMDELGLAHSNYIYDVYQLAMVKVPMHWYLERLKSLAVSHYEATHFGHNRDRNINAACIKIFKKHNQFMRDLRTKNIIT